LDGISVAAVATISPDHFAIERTFLFGNWSTVISAASGNKNWLFLHDGNTGSAATGLVDANFTFRRVKFYPPGSFVAWPYESAVVDGRGYLLLSGVALHHSPSKPVTVGFAQVLDDGSFVEWFRTELDIPYPRNVVGLRDAHAWYENDATTGLATVYIFDVKTVRMLSSKKLDRGLDGIVVDGERICLYTQTKAITEICVLDINHQLVSMKLTDFDGDFFTDHFDLVASTPGAHLFYERAPFTDNLRHDDASVRVFRPEGVRITTKVRNEHWAWHKVMRC
jgi:hypothetical protein